MQAVFHPIIILGETSHVLPVNAAAKAATTPISAPPSITYIPKLISFISFLAARISLGKAAERTVAAHRAAALEV